VVRVIRTAEGVHAYRGTKEIVFGTRKVKKREYVVTHFRSDGDAPGPTIMERAGRDGPRRWVDWRSRHDYWLGDAERLLTNYRVVRNGSAEVAGRTGTRYEVSSRLADEKRPSVTLVVDDETGLLLSFRQTNWEGKRSLFSEFTTLVLDPEEMPERPVRAPRPSKEGGTAADPADPAFPILAPQFLPAGFEARGEGRLSRRGGTNWKTIYSDGLSWFEIRQRKAKEGAEEGVLERSVRGSHVWMRMTHDGVSVSLYGSLDPSELELVLRSLGHRE